MLPKKFIPLFCAAIALVFFASCSTPNPTSTAPSPSPEAESLTATEPLNVALAILSPTEGNQVTGSIKFKQAEDKITILANLQGLQPNSVHAWHIHEFGDASSPDGKAMGGHYNPEEMPHGLPNNPERHAGDLGNLKADSQGEVAKEITVNNISINGPQNPILGRGLIIHAETDDGGQPTGNAGSRIAQGVIGLPKA
ncbi:superoxide dismutase family protein [Acaryochloris marina]|uniref:superoxide dismutase family protein n=1 Tax=Acaryochloris marina TaxID=155978 RepID=UPI001BB0033B|nr:superoxide dismutase family protein [Acaryochloris marina]QUY44047.1 superoxide dismutase family protein [Acaryochloris marina S15]